MKYDHLIDMLYLKFVMHGFVNVYLGLSMLSSLIHDVMRIILHGRCSEL